MTETAGAQLPRPSSFVPLKETPMIVTNGWDALLLVVRCDDGRWEVRAGAGCLLLIGWGVVRFLRWIGKDDDPKPTG